MLLVDSLVLTQSLHAQLRDLLGSRSRPLNLLFRGSRDGFEGATLHAICDGVGPTVVVARVEDVRDRGADDDALDDVLEATHPTVIGGFTSKAWATAGGWQPDPKAFLFSNSKDAALFERFPVANERGSDAVLHRGGDGGLSLCFGCGDLVLLDEDGKDNAEQSFAFQTDTFRSEEDDGLYDQYSLLGAHGKLELNGCTTLFRANEIEVFAV